MLVRKFVTNLHGYVLCHRRRRNLLPAYKATLYGNTEEKSNLHIVLCVCVCVCVCVSIRLFIITLFCTKLFSLYSNPQTLL